MSTAVLVSPPPASAQGLLPVAAYVRMSTDHQQYSTQNQLDRIHAYARPRDMSVVQVFADEGKSGLNFNGRDGLRSLIAAVESGAAEFKAILVYDVSRWGRFQDADESGYYEYLCKRAGITVHYCAEQFENDGSPVSNIIKSVKRSMAGEYSRELSTKVFQGACRLIQLGFKQGGLAGYGLRRMVVDPSGIPKGILEAGQQKFLATDRVVLVPGPAAEQAVVREMFKAYVSRGLAEWQIAAELNARQIVNSSGRRWNRGAIHEILTNEKYIGHLVYHRRSGKLQRKAVPNPPEMWVRSANAFPAVVDPKLFARAQTAMVERAGRYTDEELLALLRELWARRGRVSAPLLNAEPDMPTSSTYHKRFGSLLNAYQRIGYSCSKDQSFRRVLSAVDAQAAELVTQLLAALRRIGVEVEHEPGGDRFLVAREFTLAVVTARCQRTKHDTLVWPIQAPPAVDLTIAARLNEANNAVQDYFFFPRLDRPRRHVRLRACNHRLLEAYRFGTLEPLLTLAARVSISNTL